MEKVVKGKRGKGEKGGKVVKGKRGKRWKRWLREAIIMLNVELVPYSIEVSIPGGPLECGTVPSGCLGSAITGGCLEFGTLTRYEFSRADTFHWFRNPCLRDRANAYQNKCM